MFPQGAPCALDKQRQVKSVCQAKNTHAPPLNHSGDMKIHESSQQCIFAAYKLFFSHGRDWYRSVSTMALEEH